MSLEVQSIRTQLDELPVDAALVVALSGGLDSMVLLQLLCLLREHRQLRRPLRALHINHGLSPHADRWQQFCAAQCNQRQIPFKAISVVVGTGAEHSPEEHARLARYRAFATELAPSEWLLLGHHLDDQLETLLLRLTRGAGPGSLAGMPRSRVLGKGMLLRPLLAVQRDSLLRFAAENALQWIEDESNNSSQFDRNFWRHEVLPGIARRFPGFRQSWQKSMTLCQEADQLCEDLAVQDLRTVATGDQRVLKISGLLELSATRRRNVLRHWMLSAGFVPPGWQFLKRLSEELVVSEKQGAKLCSDAGTVQKYSGLLLLMRNCRWDSASECDWSVAQQPVCTLPQNGLLYAVGLPRDEAPSQCLRQLTQPLTVRYGHGGQEVRLAGRPAKSIRKVLQAAALPGWLRPRQPLLYLGDQLVCIPGIGVAQAFRAGPDEPAVRVDWQPPDLLFPLPGGN